MSPSIELGSQLGLWTLAPFALHAARIAILPLAAPCWFENNRNKGIVAFVLGVPTVVYLVGRFGDVGLRTVGHHRRGIRLVHHPAVRSLHHLGRHLPHR